MRKYLLPKEGRFYKANLHCHSTLSDGDYTPEQLKEHYKSRGYSILAITDHEWLNEHSYLDDEDFLTITGFELEVLEPTHLPNKQKKVCHINFFAKEQKNTTLFAFNPKHFWSGNREKAKTLKHTGPDDYERVYSAEGVNDILRLAKENGFLSCLNHPDWSLQNLDDYRDYDGFTMMEIYNYSSDIDGSYAYAAKDYDNMLRMGKKLFVCASDDNHDRFAVNHPHHDSFGGFTYIKAPELKYEAVINALEKGDFYASMGPEIHELYAEDGKIYVKTSPAKRIIMIPKGRNYNCVSAFEGEHVTEAVFELNDLEYEEYFRFEVIDERGRRAATRAYYLNEILG
ncbi:MAG TPA: PHP domain-containing protein [Clostridiales bacterium]|nr:PHP domain-containing protein [Clostridiales bacterium]HPP68681.1 PHP domain-containing protein [Clostridiales bacterium]